MMIKKRFRIRINLKKADSNFIYLVIICSQLTARDISLELPMII
jgi:hypothetical protein